MIDILTTPISLAASSALPFDWSLIGTGRIGGGAWHDYTNPCVGPVHRTEPLEIRALALDDSLCTAVILSLFCDRRADDDAVLPRGSTDRRGWCGDEFATPASGAPRDNTDLWGSHLWLCYTTKTATDVLERARFAAWESLQWMVRTEIASRVAVTAQWAGAQLDRLAVRPQIYQGDDQRPVYDVLWGTTLRRAAS